MYKSGLDGGVIGSNRAVVTLKQVRLAHFIDHPNYVHVQADLEGRAAVEQVFVTQTQSARSA